MKKINRHIPDIVWSKKSWIYNIFRFYELIFGRKCHPNGDAVIRVESSTTCWIDKNGKRRITRKFYTLESRLVYIECLVKEYFAKLIINYKYSLSNYRSILNSQSGAIAFDATVDNNSTGTAITYSHTVFSSVF